ncbi:MAG: aspartate/glutamate racemase family protein, partial [Candidatus Limnocylindria bacterium]
MSPPRRRPLLKGGRTLYGLAVGILMLDTRFPRPPGDVGNAATWPFPVRYRIVKGAESRRVIGETDPALLTPFIAAAKELESEGVRAITTSCGFLAIFQRELQAAVSVPVLTSALLQVPLVSRTIGPESRVAILTSRDQLTERHFTGVGWSTKDIPVVVSVLPQDAQVTNVYSSL